MPVPENIRHLCQAVPWPPEGVLVEGAAAAQLSAATQQLPFSLPPELQDFLSFLNGPCIGPGGILGIQTTRPALDLLIVLEQYPTWKANAWIPVAGDGCGNYYVMVLGQFGRHPICFVDTVAAPNELAYVVGSNLWKFLEFLLERELGRKGWPFSAEFVLERDPNLANIECAPLPWNA